MRKCDRILAHTAAMPSSSFKHGMKMVREGKSIADGIVRAIFAPFSMPPRLVCCAKVDGHLKLVRCQFGQGRCLRRIEFQVLDCIARENAKTTPKLPGYRVPIIRPG